jgi:hypothetical protein
MIMPYYLNVFTILSSLLLFLAADGHAYPPFLGEFDQEESSCELNGEIYSFILKKTSKPGADPVVLSVVGENTAPCLTLQVSWDEMALDHIASASKCTTPHLPTGTPGLGKCLLDYSIQFAKGLGLSSIELYDKSAVNCEQEGKNVCVIPFGLAYLFTKGTTWYGSKGFTPKLDHEKHEYERLQRVFNDLTAVDLKKRLTQTSYSLFKLSINENELGRSYLNRVWKHNCRAFSDLVDAIKSKFQVKSISEGAWSLELSDKFPPPLIWDAAARGDLPSVKLLLKNQLENPEITYHFKTPLQIAYEGKKPSVVFELLRNPRVNVNQKQGPDSDSPIVFAFIKNRHNLLFNEIVKNQKFKFDEKDGEGMTLLHQAARFGNSEVLQKLLMSTKFDWHLNRGPSYDKLLTPLFLAAQKNHVNAVRTLLQSPKLDLDHIEVVLDSVYSSDDKENADAIERLLKEKLNQANSNHKRTLRQGRY